MRPEAKALIGVAAYFGGLIAFAEWCNWRAGRYEPELPFLPESDSQTWEPLKPSVAIAVLPEQASLYEAIGREFAKGVPFVCIGSAEGPSVPGQTEGALDPPAEVVRRLQSQHLAIYPLSSCRSTGEDVLQTATGSKGGVLVVVKGADRNDRSVRLAVSWCCWVGWGTLYAELTDAGWQIKGKGQWVQT